MTTVSQDTLDAFKRQARPWLVELIRNTAPATGSGGGSSAALASMSHSDLTNLGADDHTHYLTAGRGDLRYVPLSRLVSAGAGLTGGGYLSANIAITLAQPGTLGVATTNTATGNHTHAVAAADDVSAGLTSLLKSNAGGLGLKTLSSTVDLTLSPTQDIVLTPGGAVRLTDGKTIRSASFASGFTGEGFRIDQGVGEAGKTTAEFDNLWVRGRMHVYELLIHQIRATNGSIFVSNTGKVAALTYISGPNWQIDTDPEHGLAAGDLIRAQRFTGDGGYQCNMQVASVATAKRFTATFISGNSPAVGMEFVRLGNTADTNRQGGIYMTADDSNAPYIDVFNGVNSFAAWNSAGVIKARLGRLSGLSIGSPGEYGLYVGTGMTTADNYIKAGTAGVTQNNVASTWYTGGSKLLEIDATNGLRLYTTEAAWNDQRGYTFSTGTETFGGTYGWHGPTDRIVGVRAISSVISQVYTYLHAENNGTGLAASSLNAVSAWGQTGGRSTAVTARAQRNTDGTVEVYAGGTTPTTLTVKGDNTTTVTGSFSAGTSITAGTTLAVGGSASFSSSLTAASFGSFNGGLIVLQYTSAPYNGVSISATASGWWAKRFGFHTSGGGSDLGGFGALGNGGAITTYWIGPSYDAPFFTLAGDTGLATVNNGRLDVGSNSVSTADSYINIGQGRTGSGNSYVDLIGDTTYADYGLRILRRGGSTGASEIVHRGTGEVKITANDAGSVGLYTNSVQKVKVLPSITVNSGAAQALAERPLGLIVISNLTTGGNAMFGCSGSAGAIGHIYTNGFTTTAGNGGTTNFYFSGGAYYLQNSTAVQCTYYITIIGGV